MEMRAVSLVLVLASTAAFPADFFPSVLLSGDITANVKHTSQAVAEPDIEAEHEPVALAQFSGDVLFTTIDQSKCPNLCSGRGRCIVNSDPNAPPLNTTICVCDQGWTNYDCSTILGGPHRQDGLDCPNNCSSHGVCYRGSSVLFPRCYCDPQWTGADCSKLRESFLLCPNNCSGYGVCTLGYSTQMNGVVGKCLCDSLHAGDNCSEPRHDICPNGCSAHGNCTAQGCVCEAGRLGADCSLVAVAACPNNCSSHGRCIDGHCMCYPGFGGDDCTVLPSVVCPGDCNGHGQCVGDNGYFPSGCRCDPEWTGPSCDHKRIPRDKCANNCSEHGHCTSDLRCLCFLGWTGLDCSVPAAFSPAALERVDGDVVHPLFMDGTTRVARDKMPGVVDVVPPPTCPSNCSSHGVCLEVAENVSTLYAAGAPSGSPVRVFVCKCDPGYSGPDCTVEDVPNSGIISAAEAVMVPRTPPAAAGTGKQPLFAADPVSWDVLPSMDDLRNLAQGCPRNCSSRGRCLRNPDGTKTCSCYTGWAGIDCGTKADVKFDCPLQCSGHGKCVTATEWFPIHCMCDEGWYGELCDRQRPPRLVYKMAEGLCPNSCSNRGVCIDGKCVCLEMGYGGPDCSVAAGGVCDKNCNGNGLCFWGLCECFGGYSGALCDVEPSKPCPNQCGMKGKCVGGKCICLSGFTGDDCSDIVVVCPNHCSGHGACIPADMRDHRPARCECAAGWTGADCSNFPLAVDVPPLEQPPTQAEKFYAHMTSTASASPSPSPHPSKSLA